MRCSPSSSPLVPLPFASLDAVTASASAAAAAAADAEAAADDAAAAAAAQASPDDASPALRAPAAGAAADVTDDVEVTDGVGDATGVRRVGWCSQPPGALLNEAALSLAVGLWRGALGAALDAAKDASRLRRPLARRLPTRPGGGDRAEELIAPGVVLLSGWLTLTPRAERDSADGVRTAGGRPPAGFALLRALDSIMAAASELALFTS